MKLAKLISRLRFAQLAESVLQGCQRMGGLLNCLHVVGDRSPCLQMVLRYRAHLLVERGLDLLERAAHLQQALHELPASLDKVMADAADRYLQISGDDCNQLLPGTRPPIDPFSMLLLTSRHGVQDLCC